MARPRHQRDIPDANTVVDEVSPLEEEPSRQDTASLLGEGGTDTRGDEDADGTAEEAASEHEELADVTTDVSQSDAPQDDTPEDDVPHDDAPQDDAGQGDEPLDDADQGSEPRDDADRDDTLPHPGPTVEIPRPETDDEPQAATFKDVTRAAGSFARGRWSALQVFLHGHTPLAITVCLLLAVATVIIVLLASHLADLPTENLILKDVRSRYAQADYTPGTYGSDEPLTLTSAEILSCDRTGDAHECDARVALSYVSDSVSLLEEIELTYELSDDDWVLKEAGDYENRIYTATAGVDTAKASDNVGLVLSKAETMLSADDESALSLLSLYADADVSIVEERFDAEAQDEQLTFHLAQSSAFTSYECDVSARFVFRPGNGVWELASASASKGAKDLRLSPLIGTWTGTFTEQESTGAKCLGAKDAVVSVTIDAADSDHISGTLSCVAHYHGDLERDAEGTEGDIELEGVPFSGTGDAGASGISFVCTTPDDAKGEVLLRLDFGTPDDPSSAAATVYTSSDYVTYFLFIPYETEARFADTYRLTKAEE